MCLVHGLGTFVIVFALFAVVFCAFISFFGNFVTFPGFVEKIISLMKGDFVGFGRASYCFSSGGIDFLGQFVDFFVDCSATCVVGVLGFVSKCFDASFVAVAEMMKLIPDCIVVTFMFSHDMLFAISIFASFLMRFFSGLHFVIDSICIISGCLILLVKKIKLGIIWHNNHQPFCKVRTFNSF